jgi:hypothetical protein
MYQAVDKDFGGLTSRIASFHFFITQGHFKWDSHTRVESYSRIFQTLSLRFSIAYWFLYRFISHTHQLLTDEIII